MDPPAVPDRSRIEALRERASLRYYDLARLRPQLDRSDPQAPNTQQQQEVPQAQQPADLPPQRPSPSDDHVLTALAQLAAIRTNAKRALISLFDSEYQYVIAESTQTLPLRRQRAAAPASDDKLWLASTAIPRSVGICEHALLNERRGVAVSSITVVPDLTNDARFSSRPHVRGYPYNRFYACSPITTAKRLDIGTLAIYDPEPRPNGLTVVESELLQDLTVTIMEHLESRRIRTESRRSERMVRGIGSFVEGSSTLAGWWSNKDVKSYMRTAGEEGLLDTTQQGLAQLAAIDAETGHEQAQDPAGSLSREALESLETPPVPDFRPSSMGGNARPPMLQRYSSDRATIKPAPADPHRVRLQLIFAKAANIIRESVEVEGVVFVDARPSSFGSMVGGQTSESSDSDIDARRAASARVGDHNAADASVKTPLCEVLAFSTTEGSSVNARSIAQTFQVSETLLKVMLRRYKAGKIFNFDHAGALQASESEESDRSRAKMTDEWTDNSAASIEEDKSIASTSTIRRKRKVLKYSRRNDAASVIAMLPEARSVMFLPLWDFQRERWFAGAMAWTRQKDRTFSVRGDLSYMSAFASSLMSQVARLDAVAVDQAKTDLIGSISHELRSPLHGVLGGVEMLSDTSIDVFQGDVLHTIESCGRTLLDTIDNLLDYSKINNFMSTSRHGTVGKRSTHGGRASTNESGHESIESGMTSLSADVRLDTLVEDILESVYAGYSFSNLGSRFPTSADEEGLRMLSSPPGSAAQTPMDAMETGMQWSSPPKSEQHHGSVFGPLPAELSASANVAVVLDIQTRHDGATANEVARGWLFHTQPGAVRRMLMNVFGNALKYTSGGQIKVSLSSSANDPPTPVLSTTRRTHPNRHGGRTEVVFTVADSGKGMSSEYLLNHLFAPFSQEDRLAPGTGLGLSLVQRIISGLGGTINVTSKLDIGTAVTMKLPLWESERRPRRGSRGSGSGTTSLLAIAEEPATKGLRVALAGFWEPSDGKQGTDSSEYQPDEDAASRTPANEFNSEHWHLPRKEIEAICRFSLEMEVLSTITTNNDFTINTIMELSPRPDLILATETGAEQVVRMLLSQDSSQSISTAMGHMPPMVVVCRNIMVAKARSTWNDRRVVLEWISQPCGPRKLAKAFALATTRYSELNLELDNDSLPQSPASAQSYRLPNSSFSLQESMLTPRGEKAPTPAGFQLLEARAAQHSADLPRLSADSSAAALDRNVFLLVEDNSINLQLLVAFMRKKGFAYHTAENGLIAVELYEKHHRLYRTVVMDISMPVMNGLEASRQIRNFERVQKLPQIFLIAVTGLASESAQQEAFASGINLFLTKPVRLKELNEVINGKKSLPPS